MTDQPTTDQPADDQPASQQDRDRPSPGASQQHPSPHAASVDPHAVSSGSKTEACRAGKSLWPIGVVLAAVVAIVIATLPGWLVSPEGVRQYLRRAVPGLDGDVRVKTASIGWFSPLSIQDLSLVPTDGTAPPVKVQAISGNRGLFAILSDGGRLGRIDVSGLTLDLVFDEQHISNLQRLIGRRPQRPRSAAVAPEKPPAPPQPLTSDADERVQISVAGARVQVRGPWTNTPWSSDPIDIKAVLRRTTAGQREWSLAPVKLLDHARLEPSVAAGVLAYAAPILADATRTSGEFSLVIDEARWPAGRGDEATVAGVLTLHEVDIGPGPLVAGLVRSLPGRLPAPPTVRVAEASRVQFRQAQRRVWHEGLTFGIPLAEQGRRLDIESSGSVGIDDRSIDMTLALPLPGNLSPDRPLLSALAGKTLRLQVEGSLDEPKLKLDESLKSTVAAVAGDVIENFRSKDAAAGARGEPPRAADLQSGAEAKPSMQPEPAETSADSASAATPGKSGQREQIKSMLPPEVAADPATDAVIDAVGGLLDEVARRRANRKQEAANPSPELPTGASRPDRNRPGRRLLRQLLEAASGPADQSPADGPEPASKSAAADDTATGPEKKQ